MAKLSVLKIFTRDSFAKMAERGGSGDWVADMSRVIQMRYIVCVRNRTGQDAAQDVEHGTAFLIGKIEKVEESGGRRLFVRISKFKNVNVPNAWDGSQNPVRYMTLEDAEAAFGKFDEESWESFPQPASPSAETQQPSQEQSIPVGLTIRQAKEGLARTFGVDESCIEITIRS